MATKKELFELVSKEVEALCKKHGTPVAFNAAMGIILSDNLAPKSSGASVNLAEVTKVDGQGKVTHIQCSVSGKFLPATKEYFYEDKAGKGINGLKRLSRQAEAIRKTHAKTVSKSEKAITSDVLNGKLKREDGKAKIEALRATKPDYSSVK